MTGAGLFITVMTSKKTHKVEIPTETIKAVFKRHLKDIHLDYSDFKINDMLSNTSYEKIVHNALRFYVNHK